MSSSRFSRMIAVVIVAALPCTSGAAAESRPARQRASPQPPVSERLKRVGSEIFSGRADVKHAIQELKDILAADPRSAEAHMLLGVAYRMTGSPDLIGESTAELRQALALDPQLLPARVYLARVYLDLGRPARAKEELETALAQGQQVQPLSLLGEVERQLGNPRRSIELNRQALAADASFAQARYYLGLALLDAGERDEGILELERVVKSGANQVEVFSSLGAAYLEAGRVDEALGTLNGAVKLEPSRPDIRIQLARAYRSKGMLARAEEQIRAVTPQAIAALAAGVQQQQVEFDLQLELGVLAMAQRRLPAAIEALKAALTMEPAHGPANRHLAEAYLLTGAYKLAAEHAARAAKAGHPLAGDKQRALQEALRGGAARKTP